MDLKGQCRKINERRLSENEIEKTYMNDSNTQKERKPVRKIACKTLEEIALNVT